jgi:hypothetical protein
VPFELAVLTVNVLVKDVVILGRQGKVPQILTVTEGAARAALHPIIEPLMFLIATVLKHY